MNFVHQLFRTKIFQTVDKSRVSRLYEVSEQSMIFAMGFVFFTSIALYPKLGQNILIWSIVLGVLLSYRLYMSYDFKRNPERYSIKTWHILFTVMALLTAFIISFLGFVALRFVTDFYQFFIVTVLIGFSAGATTSLSLDLRIAMGYTSIILVPLIITLFMVEIQLHVIMALLTMLYFVTQITIIYKAYMQELRINNVLKKLAHQSEHDVLTGLLNRRGFQNHMQNLVSEKEHEISYSLLFYLDLNQFKSINDALGHVVGDEVLLSVSKRLMRTLGKTCKMSRLGGDEFVVVVPYVSMKESVAKDTAKAYEKQIANMFIAPFIAKDIHLHIRSSIGIIIIEPNYANIEEIIRHADITMYQAKKSYGNISYYNKALDEKQKKLFILQHDLQNAVIDNQLSLFYQPIVRMNNDVLFSAEALMRWNHPTKGLLQPLDFIPLAIQIGLLSKMTWWLVDEVCGHIKEWKTHKQWKLKCISININSQQLVETNFATLFLDKLASHEISPSEIMIEITERSLIDNFESTEGVISVLRSYGVRCAIDDFGIGYSSLSYLQKLSFDTLKIDREFIKNILYNKDDIILIKTILAIGKQFKYHIVVEGIEEEEQKELLLEIDEDLSYQGYLLSKPLSFELFTENFLSKT